LLKYGRCRKPHYPKLATGIAGRVWAESAGYYNSGAVEKGKGKGAGAPVKQIMEPLKIPLGYIDLDVISVDSL